MAKLINLTPHEINIITPEGEMKIPPSGVIARVGVIRERIGEVFIDGKFIPVYKNKFGSVENLPDPKPDTLYVVSSIVAQAVSNRKDVVVPDDSVRDEQGSIIGVRALAQI